LATVIGNTGFRAGSLEFGPDGSLYGGGGGANAGQLFRIDPATGTSTLVAATGIGTISGLALRSLGGLLADSITVTIPAGAASVNVDLASVQDFLIDGDQIAKVVAYAPRFASGEDTVVVTDSAQRLSLTVTVTGPALFPENAGAAASSGVVSVNAASTSDLTVSLRSHDVSEASVAPSIIIPAGQLTSAPFSIDAVDDLTVDGSVTVSITAFAANAFSGRATVTVTDDGLDSLPPGIIVWTPQGPGPATNGQVENVRRTAAGPVVDDVVGAIHTVLAHPTNPDILYAGGVNGGVWRTLNATSPQPTWQPLTD
jgi:uncharacterized repeat protein (TIGR03803 family)